MQIYSFQLPYLVAVEIELIPTDKYKKRSMISDSKLRSFKIILLLCIFLLGNIQNNYAQSYLETFGQNRIQTRKYDWKYFDTEHFRIYHYDAAGRQLARYVAEQAEKDIKIITKKMGGKFPHRFNIILYNNYDEYRQTNIGKKFDDQIQNTKAGTVDLVGDRLVIYFTGVHTDVRRQLRSGMSRVVMERMLFGENFRSMVKNAVIMNLPTWLTDGYIDYIVDGWDATSESTWKNLLEGNPKHDFYDFTETEPELAGKAFWKYISEKYGEQNVKNLLTTMELKSSLPQGLKMTTGLSLKQTFDSLIQYYNTIYTKDALVQEYPDSNNRKAILEIDVPKDNTVLRNLTVSPRGVDVAYVTYKEGEFQVIIQHTHDEQKKSVIVSGGDKDYNEVPDPNYPLLAWSNNGYKLAILYKRANKTRLRIYNSLKAKLEEYVIPNNRFDRVLGMSFMEDDTKLVFSTIKKSQTDLYQFAIRGKRLTPITKDLWDDVDPVFISGGSRKGILFLSNRPLPNLNVPIDVNELPTGPMNLFFYNTTTKSPQLLQCSFLDKGKITQPIQFGPDNFAFLYDVNGINNKYVVLFGRDKNNHDSAYTVPVTNYSQSILYHQYTTLSDQDADVIQVGNKIKVYFKPLEIPDENHPPKKLYRTTLSIANDNNIAATTYPNKVVEKADNASALLKSGDEFQTEFTDDTPLKSEDSAKYEAKETAEAKPEPYPENPVDSVLVDSTYVKMKAQPYRLSFKPDFFTLRLDNSILFNKYDPAYLGGVPGKQSLAGMITVSLNDAMENHRFTGGFKLPVNFSGTSYFLQYENFTRRVDWSVLYFRTVNLYEYQVQATDPATGQTYLLPETQTGKLTTNVLQGSAVYPFDRRQSLKLHLAFRQDALHFKAKDTIGLSLLPDENQYWTMSRAEYVFDNTITPTLNILRGMRYKIFGEYFYKLSSPNGGFYNFGMDFRYYKKIYKNIISATRVAYAHSGGNQKIDYMMGGVDNWIAAKYNPMPPPASENFAFQTTATSLRGYLQNSRRGNTFGVINTEIRAPIFTTILKRPIQSALLKNMQAIVFVDAGSAWNGWVPNSANRDNYVFTSFNPATSVSVTIPSPDYGLALGYGAGLRTMLLGYFMRLDAAWNIEGRTKPIWYFSLGTDF